LALVGLLGMGAAAARAEDTPPAGPAAPSTEAEVTIPWVKNWGEAQAQAKKENKDLLINFTGSDWCGWCIRLESEVFSHAAFLEQATKQFVFVFLDFPNDPALKAAVVDAALNEKLKTTYDVRGFPSILLTTAEGLPYGRTGYQEGGPEAYLTHLAGAARAGEKIKALIARARPTWPPSSPASRP
jgi:thiol-disulfide isomerase/thioredoxin